MAWSAEMRGLCRRVVSAQALADAGLAEWLAAPWRARVLEMTLAR